MRKKIEQQIQTTNEFVDVKDIKRNLLYTKSGYMIAFLKLLPINITLLDKRELKQLTTELTSRIKAEKEIFSFLVIPRSADLDRYLFFLEEKIESEITSINKRNLLNAMVRSANNKSGQNFEHIFYLIIRDKVGNENKLNERMTEFENYYNSIGNAFERVNDSEILKICNLFTNGIISLDEENNLYYTEFSKIN